MPGYTREIPFTVTIYRRSRIEHGSVMLFRICIGTQVGVNCWTRRLSRSAENWNWTKPQNAIKYVPFVFG